MFDGLLYLVVLVGLVAGRVVSGVMRMGLELVLFIVVDMFLSRLMLGGLVSRFV